MTYRPAPHRPQPSPGACGRCGFPLTPPGTAHATTAGAAACAITRHLEQLTADGWTLPAPTGKDRRP